MSFESLTGRTAQNIGESYVLGWPSAGARQLPRVALLPALRASRAASRGEAAESAKGARRKCAGYQHDGGRR